MKIGLGTAQFGMKYGSFNVVGQPSNEEVAHILEVSRQNGIAVIDTAAQYGNSEEVLGRCLPAGHGFHIVTKTPSFRTAKIDKWHAEQLDAAFAASLWKLNQSSIYGLLFHHPQDLLAVGGALLYEAMCKWKERGLVRKIGASVYTQSQAEELLNRYDMDLIQVPVNMFDQRLIQSGLLKRIKKRGIEIHARSVFLQGLLLAEPDRLDPCFHSIRDHLARYQRFLHNNHLSKVQGAIHFLRQVEEIDAILVGVDTCRQLEEIVLAANMERSPCDFSPFSVQDEKILNPSLWRRE